MTRHYLDILRKYWGYTEFRGVQQDIIESIGAGHDTLGLMPTGGGKSITFQVPALATDGVCLVITPLVALMKDQVMSLKKRGIRAAAIHAGLSHDQVMTILENAVFGAVKILYVSPERLSSQLFQTKISHTKVCFITVDEAHCISQWGYDFRPSYLQIAQIRKLLPTAPVLALTATATPEVVDDIQERLAFKEKRVFMMSFERTNLTYDVRHCKDKTYELVSMLRASEGSAIVYVRSRLRAKEIAGELSGSGFTATFFHAGLENAEKDKRQCEWQTDKTRIIVATNAFGMGIDKPDVRMVIHIDCPDSLEAYFQEAGRAGRDGRPATATLLFNESDISKLSKRIASNYPDKEYIRTVYDHLAYYYQIGIGSGENHKFEFNPDKFCNNFGHFPIQMFSALKILERAGYIKFIEEEESASRVMFALSRDEMYRLKNNSTEEDRVVVALLRNYSGLFCEYQFVDESLIASETAMKSSEVYLILKGLAHKNIINFIPRKSTPYIIYTQRREESKHLVFKKEIYDTLKERYAKRVKTMCQYAMHDDICRSRMLLAYFGETRTANCGQCDVCRREQEADQSKLEDTKRAILAILDDGKAHYSPEILALKADTPVLRTAIRQQIDEKAISQEDGGFFKA